MDYIKRYHIIAKAMLDFEKTSCDFYLSLSQESNLDVIAGVLKKIAFEKAKEFDIFSGMITISSFLLEDNKVARYDTCEISDWLSENMPMVFNGETAKSISGITNSKKAIKAVIHLENSVLSFYVKLRKKMPMNIGQIESLIKRQQKTVATLKQIRAGLLASEDNDCFLNVAETADSFCMS